MPIPYVLIPCPSCNQSASYQMNLPRGSTITVSCKHCHKPIHVQTNMDATIRQITKGVDDQNGGSKMKNCPQCNKEVKDEAKFCGGCGYKFEVSDSVSMSGISCPSCGNVLKPGAKFCGKCGTKISESESKAIAGTDVVKQASYIHWNILPGQLALKIDSTEIAAYGRIKGLVVQEGLKALFFINGKVTAELGAGSYEFKEFPDVKIGEDKEEKKKSALGTFFSNLSNFFRGRPQLPQNVQNVSVLLVRSTEFPLVFDVKDVATAGIRSEIGLHILCKISNINDFYTNLMIDSNFISYEVIAKTIDPFIKNVLDTALNGIEADKVSGEMQAVLTTLQNKISQIYSFVTVTNIINLSAENKELENIRKMQEELYVSELELKELTKRNSFLNRLQDENNAQALHEARTLTDYQAALDKIDEDKELNEDERLKFSQMLEAQRLIREAKTENDVEAAVLQFRKSEMLREEEIDNLQAQIQQNAAVRDLNNEQVLTLATLANEKEIDRQNLLWEIEIGNKRLENELTQQRLRDAYEDERRDKDLDFDKREMQQQMDLLRQAQAIREERENAEHQRQMEANAQKIAHEEEMRRMFQNMTAEQIVAANPDITPEAAAAMAEKFKAEAAAAANDKTAEMAMKQSSDMQAFMKEQMATMRDMFVSGMNANAMNQQQIMNSQKDEMNRFTSGVNNAVSSVSGALRNPSTVINNSVCPKCGAAHADGAIFCENCGNSL